MTDLKSDSLGLFDVTDIFISVNVWLTFNIDVAFSTV
jgi:hypothetical protein